MSTQVHAAECTWQQHTTRACNKHRSHCLLLSLQVLWVCVPVVQGVPAARRRSLSRHQEQGQVHACRPPRQHPQARALCPVLTPVSCNDAFCNFVHVTQPALKGSKAAPPGKSPLPCPHRYLTGYPSILQWRSSQLLACYTACLTMEQKTHPQATAQWL